MARHWPPIAWLALALGLVLGNSCAAAGTNAATVVDAFTQQPPSSPSSDATPSPWPLLNSTPVRCASYSAAAAAPWPTVNPNDLSSLASFDPCALRMPRNADAVGPSGGPYLSRDQIEQRVLGGLPTGTQPTKLRAFLTTLATAARLTGGDSEPRSAYPDREVWLVVTQGPGCAVPSGMPGGPTPVAPRYCFGVFDATTGDQYFGGSGPPTGDDWPPLLPKD